MALPKPTTVVGEMQPSAGRRSRRSLILGAGIQSPSYHMSRLCQIEYSSGGRAEKSQPDPRHRIAFLSILHASARREG
jgi:hypothetical protein